jgi:hypothetical protein
LAKTITRRAASWGGHPCARRRRGGARCLSFSYEALWCGGQARRRGGDEDRRSSRTKRQLTSVRQRQLVSVRRPPRNQPFLHSSGATISSQIRIFPSQSGLSANAWSFCASWQTILVILLATYKRLQGHEHECWLPIPLASLAFANQNC